MTVYSSSPLQQIQPAPQQVLHGSHTLEGLQPKVQQPSPSISAYVRDMRQQMPDQLKKIIKIGAAIAGIALIATTIAAAVMAPPLLAVLPATMGVVLTGYAAWSAFGKKPSVPESKPRDLQIQELKQAPISTETQKITQPASGDISTTQAQSLLEKQEAQEKEEAQEKQKTEENNEIANIQESQQQQIGLQLHEAQDPYLPENRAFQQSHYKRTGSVKLQAYDIADFVYHKIGNEFGTKATTFIAKPDFMPALSGTQTGTESKYYCIKLTSTTYGDQPKGYSVRDAYLFDKHIRKRMPSAYHLFTAYKLTDEMQQHLKHKTGVDKDFNKDILIMPYYPVSGAEIIRGIEAIQNPKDQLRIFKHCFGPMVSSLACLANCNLIHGNLTESVGCDSEGKSTKYEFHDGQWMMDDKGHVKLIDIGDGDDDRCQVTRGAMSKTTVQDLVPTRQSSEEIIVVNSRAQDRLRPAAEEATKAAAAIDINTATNRKEKLALIEKKERLERLAQAHRQGRNSDHACQFQNIHELLPQFKELVARFGHGDQDLQQIMQQLEKAHGIATEVFDYIYLDETPDLSTQKYDEIQQKVDAYNEIMGQIYMKCLQFVTHDSYVASYFPCDRDPTQSFMPVQINQLEADTKKLGEQLQDLHQLVAQNMKNAERQV